MKKWCVAIDYPNLYLDNMIKKFSKDTVGKQTSDFNEKSVNKQCLLDTPSTVPVWPWKWGQAH